jgi:menaquinone-dependent protoporphyrinogen oxidase
VLGSAVYIGSWIKEAREHGLSDEARTELEELVHPREHGVFFGAIDPDRLGFIERRMVKAVKAPVGDFRDWEKIGAFADRIADALSREPATAR